MPQESRSRVRPIRLLRSSRKFPNSPQQIMPPQQSGPNSARHTASLRKEVTELKRQLAKLTKTVEALQKPRPMRATKLVVDALEIVDPKGNVVASIDKAGNLHCRTVLAAADKNVRGVFIDGGNARKISAGSLELIEPGQKKPALVAIARADSAKLTLRDLTSKQSLDLNGGGAFLQGYDKTTGTAAVELSALPAAGGRVTVFGTRKSSKARVTVSVSDSNGAGQIAVTDATGAITANLP